MPADGSGDIPDLSMSDFLQPVLADLPAICSTILISLYKRDAQIGDDGNLYPIDGFTRITPQEGLELLRLAREQNGKSLLEVGLANGFSSQFLLAALNFGGGRLISIDPYQSSVWHGIGSRLANFTANELAADLGLNKALRFDCIEERSDWALPQLIRDGEMFDLIFIDGYHRFDDVLIDVSLSARICRDGGLIVLHDLFLPSVRAVVGFLEANRTDLQRLPNSCWNLAVFRRLGGDNRFWDHFVPFSSADNNLLKI